MVLNFQCLNCKVTVPRKITKYKRGTRYRILFDCPRCKRTIHISGTSEQVPPKVVQS